MNTSIVNELNRIDAQISKLQEHKQKLEALLPFYQNGIIKIERDFPVSIEKKLHKNKSINGRSIHSYIVDLAKAIANDRGIVFSKQVLDVAMGDELFSGKSRGDVSRKISNTIGIEVQRGNFKKVKPGKYRIKN